MTHAAYRAGIAAIAQAEADGEDVSGRIAQLARVSGTTIPGVRHEVTETADLG